VSASAIAATSTLLTAPPPPVTSTIALLKPDAVRRRLVGRLLYEIEKSPLQVEKMRLTQFGREEASEFYAEHEGREYFEPLVAFMVSGPLVALSLIGDDAVRAWRTLIGHSDPRLRHVLTLRSRYAAENALVHGSDSPTASLREFMQLRNWGCL
jgi:nucleoside-diphosphate kinase